MVLVFSDPEKEYVYKLFREYFDHVELQKIRDDNEFSIYMAKLRCLLLNEQRYLVIMTKKDQYPPFYKVSIDDVRWVSLQTRTLKPETIPQMTLQSYELKRNDVFEETIEIISRTKKISVYKMERLPITISLLHVHNQEYEYPDIGTLNSALETFRTIIQFTS